MGLTAALAQTPFVRSETVAQLRHDLLGAESLGTYAFLHLQQSGPVAVDGYLGLTASIPEQRPDVQIYALNVAGSVGKADWRLGTQQAATVLRPQTFDGGWLALPLNDATSLTVWGGWARHHDLDDLADGIAIGRAEIRHLGSVVSLWGGAQLEGADGEARLVGRQDAAVRFGTPRDIAVTMEGAWAESTDRERVQVERARVLWEGQLTKAVGGTLWVERRRTAVETLLADDLLAVFAPDGVDQIGVRLRGVTPRRASMFASAAVGHEVGAPEDEVLLQADAGWAPSPGTVLPSLRWRMRAGPRGAYHAFLAARSFRVGDRTRVLTRGGVVPYRRGGDAWRVAGTAGGDLERRIGDGGSLQIGTDVATDAVWALDVRGHVALTLEWP